MAIPQLNMDGYLLKQIKAETARANAADAALQGQITELQNGIIKQSVAISENGFRMIDADELIYWTGQSSLDSYKKWSPTFPTPVLNGGKKIGNMTILYDSWTSRYQEKFPWSETEFNRGKPYLAVIGYQTAITLSGGSAAYFEATLEIGSKRMYSGQEDYTYLDAYTHTQNQITHANICDFIAFTKPVVVDGPNTYSYWGLQFRCKQWVDGDAGDISIRCYNPYDLYRQTDDAFGLNLYVNFPKTTD